MIQILALFVAVFVIVPMLAVTSFGSSSTLSVTVFPAVTCVLSFALSWFDNCRKNWSLYFSFKDAISTVVRSWSCILLSSKLFEPSELSNLSLPQWFTKFHEFSLKWIKLLCWSVSWPDNKRWYLTLALVQKYSIQGSIAFSLYRSLNWWRIHQYPQSMIHHVPIKKDSDTPTAVQCSWVCIIYFSRYSALQYKSFPCKALSAFVRSVQDCDIYRLIKIYFSSTRNKLTSPLRRVH